jgi:nucleoid DNA-binding protein
MEEKQKNRKIDLSMPGRDRHWFVKRVAEKSNFFQKDIDELLDVMEDVLSEVIGEKETLKIQGLFTMYLTEKNTSKYYDPREKKVINSPKTSYYVSFKASRQLLKYLPEMQEEKDLEEKL